MSVSVQDSERKREASVEREKRTGGTRRPEEERKLDKEKRSRTLYTRIHARQSAFISAR